MNSPHEILKKYWGFDQFRSMQEEIIQSVLDGNDTLALLPTGGGKSICFQVPALCSGKLCLVISPLIALMKDQVQQLEKRNISAGMISSSMHPDEVSLILSKAMKGDLSFLYISPERLKNEGFISTIPYLEIGLIAIDEAHCISQWGYDFRPAYLEIANIRPLFKGVNIIALTATATPEVVEDICLRLELKKANRFQKSFLRANLAYVVRHTEDKHGQLIRILEKIPGTSVVYVRNRKRCKDVADFLQKNGVAASYYHGGLDSASRNLRQQSWIDNKIRVIVCTNAFGMGIDKPDVRTVVHLDMPDTPEAYFQEAGRAGRDELPSWAVLLNDPADEDEALERFMHSWPGFDTIKAIYNWAGNFLQLPVTSGEGLSFPFDLTTFISRYKIHPVECINALKFIESQNLFSFNENTFTPSRVMMNANREEVYEFELRNPLYEPLIKAILRSYGGAFNDYVNIRERDLAERINLQLNDTIGQLNFLNQHGVIRYHQSNDNPTIFYIEGRHHPDRIPLSLKAYEERKNAALKRFKAMLKYVNSDDKCRSSKLIEYFGEKDIPDCGMCDVCINKRKSKNADIEKDKLIFKIKVLISDGINKPDQLIQSISGNPENTLGLLRELIDSGRIQETKNNNLIWII
jgi:ATP-dependent DNA helicase RecQ